MQQAVARHVRRVTPERRDRLPPELNWYSVRNRFLLRLKNQDAAVAVRFLVPAVAHDLQVVGYVAAVGTSYGLRTSRTHSG